MTPAFEKPLVVLAALVYFAAVLAVGWWKGRAVRGAADFFIAGKRAGLLAMGLSTTAAAFSGFVFLGGPGLTYRIGLAALFIVISVGFTAGLMGFTVAVPLRRLAETHGVLTIPEAIEARFGSRRASGLAAAGVLAGTVGYLGLQIQALGLLIDSIGGLRAKLGEAGPLAAMAAGLALVLAYSARGGMAAGLYVETLQGLVMVAAAGGVFIRALQVGGGLDRMAATIAASPDFGPEFLDPFGKVPAATAMGFFFLFSVGVLGQPHVLHKFFMLRDPQKLRHMPLVVGVSQSLCLLIWLGVGLAVPALVAGGTLAPLSRPDDAAPVFLMSQVPDWLAGLALAGILAAVMSTADALLSVGAAALVRDLPRACGREPFPGLFPARLATLGLGFAAGLFSWFYGGLIAWLGTFAFGLFGAALAPVLAVGLNWKKVGARAACFSIGGGLTSHLVLELWSRLAALEILPGPPLARGVLPGVVSLCFSFLLLFLVTWYDQRRPPR